MTKVFEVRPGILRSFFFPLLNIVHRLGWNNPPLRVDIINGELNSLSTMLGEEPQVFPGDRPRPPRNLYLTFEEFTRATISRVGGYIA